MGIKRGRKVRWTNTRLTFPLPFPTSPIDRVIVARSVILRWSAFRVLMYFLPAVQPVLQAAHFQYGFQKHRLHSNPALKIQKKKLKKKKKRQHYRSKALNVINSRTVQAWELILENYAAFQGFFWQSVRTLKGKCHQIKFIGLILNSHMNSV